MNHRLTSILVIRLAAMLPLSACGQKATEGPAATEETTTEKVVEEVKVDEVGDVSIVVPSDNFYDAEAIAKAFMEKYPNVTIKFGQTHDASQDEAAFLTRAATGDVDDVFGGGDENPDMYGPRGIYIDLKPYLEADADLWFNDEKFANWWIYENPDGAIYSVPVVGNPMVVVYNKALLEAAGLEAPPERYDDPAQADWTWEKFETYAAAMTKEDVWGVGIENNILIYWPMIYSNGGRLVNEAMDDYLVDDPKVVEALDFMTGLVLDGYGPDPAAANEMGGMGELFVNGKLGMFIVGAWMVEGAWGNALEDFGIDIGIATLPHNGTYEGIVLCPAMRQGISSYSKNPAVAYEWLKFYYFEADEIHKAKTDWNPFLSTLPRVDLLHELYESGVYPHSSWGHEEKSLEFLATNHCSPPYIMSNPPWNGPFPETRDITLAEMGLVFSGEQSLQDAITNINDQADLAMKRFQPGK